MTTLADMTEEERAQCVGMWCEDVEGALGIYLGEAVNNEWVGVCVHPPSIYPFSSVFQDLTPRPDLPRAWNPNGTPVKGSWTEAEYIGDSHGMRDVYHFDGTPTHRYFQTEWEEIPNA